MVAQTPNDQHYSIKTVTNGRHISVSYPKVCNIEMKMLQQIYHRAVIKDSVGMSARNSLPAAAPAKHCHRNVEPRASDIQHRPRITAIERKPNYVQRKTTHVQINVKSSTLPPRARIISVKPKCCSAPMVPVEMLKIEELPAKPVEQRQPNKVTHLIKKFEAKSSTVPRVALRTNNTPLGAIKKRLVPQVSNREQVKTVEMTTAQETSPKTEEDTVKTDSVQRKSVKELCKFFEQEAWS